MRNIASIAAVMCCFFTINAAQAQEDAKQLRRAQKLYQSRKYHEAAAVLESISRQQPAHPEAYRLLGHVYYQLGRSADARKAMAKAVEYGRLTVDVLARLAQIDQQQNQTTALLEGLRLRILVDPKNIEWNLLYADTLTAAGAADEAKRIYKTIIEAEPAHPDVFVRLGNLYLRQGKPTKAASAFATAYHLGDANPRLPQTIAELWFNAGDRAQALLWYERAMRLQDTPNENARLRWVELLLWAGDLKQAETTAKSLTNLADPDLAAKALILLGRIAMQRKQPKIAVARWEKAVAKGTTDPKILAFLGSRYFNSGQYNKAAVNLARNLASGGPDKSIQRYLIISLVRSNEYKRAKGEIQTYLERYGLDDDISRLISAFVRTAEKTNVKSGLGVVSN